MKVKILYLLFCVAVFLSCSKSYLKDKENFTHYSLKENSENKKAQLTVTKYKAKVTAETEKIIATSSEALLKDDNESTLGNFVCDALFYNGNKIISNTNIDLVIINRGGLRVNLPKGNIKVINIFELMPFENELVLIQISGEKLLEGIKLITEKKHPFYGMKIQVTNANTEVTIENHLIDKSKNYNILTSDYLATGGDNFLFFKNPISLQKTDLKIRDAIINYCNYFHENQKQIIPYKDGRFQISN